MSRYVDALVNDIRNQAPLAQPETIFFGGGTPSLLSVEHWKKIFKTLADVGWTSVKEFTIECNPSTISESKAVLFRENGVNRISIGVQSFDENLLHRLGRPHSRNAVLRAFQTLRKAGFENINLDLMFALPDQTEVIWEETLKQALDLESEHLSCYEVIYEEGTPLFEQMRGGAFEVDEALAEAMYERLLCFLEENGFEQYEIANFARQSKKVKGVPELACLHNVNYWIGGEYLGLGPSASGHVKGVRYQNWASTELYCQAIEKAQLPRGEGERLSAFSKASEVAAFSLRMNRGIHLGEFFTKTGYDFRSHWRAEWDELTARDWAEEDEGCFRLTKKGLRFADAAAAEVLKITQ